MRLSVHLVAAAAALLIGAGAAPSSPASADAALSAGAPQDWYEDDCEYYGDCDDYDDDVDHFGAIAIDVKTQLRWSGVWNYHSQSEAENGALADCRRDAGGDCKIAIWFRNACGALAGTPQGHWGADWDANRAEAERKAVAACEYYAKNGTCALRRSICTD